VDSAGAVPGGPATDGGRFYAELMSAHVRHLRGEPYVPVLGEQPGVQDLFVLFRIFRLLLDRRFPESTTAADVSRHARDACARAGIRERNDEVNSGLQAGQVRIAEALIRWQRGEDWVMDGITEDEAGPVLFALVFDLIADFSVAEVMELVAEAERLHEQ
jgi:hypothetical protein